MSLLENFQESLKDFKSLGDFRNLVQESCLRVLSMSLLESCLRVLSRSLQVSCLGVTSSLVQETLGVCLGVQESLGVQSGRLQESVSLRESSLGVSGNLQKTLGILARSLVQEPLGVLSRSLVQESCLGVSRSLVLESLGVSGGLSIVCLVFCDYSFSSGPFQSSRETSLRDQSRTMTRTRTRA